MHSQWAYSYALEDSANNNRGDMLQNSKDNCCNHEQSCVYVRVLLFVTVRLEFLKG